MKEVLFIRELYLPNVCEILSEKFDGVTELLTENSFIYGGVLRDIVAGKEMLGDVDITVNSTEFNSLVGNFENSAKWVRDNVLEYERDKAKRQPSAPERFRVKAFSSVSSGKSPRNYRESSAMRVQDVLNFVNSENQKVQIVLSSCSNLDSTDNALFPARNVDIICCGLVMDRNGRVFEVVFDAENQAKKGILRLNDIEGLNRESLQKRVDKLVKRGWNSEIDFKKLDQKAKRAIQKAEKKWKKSALLKKNLKKNETKEDTPFPEDKASYWKEVKSSSGINEGVKELRAGPDYTIEIIEERDKEIISVTMHGTTAYYATPRGELAGMTESNLRRYEKAVIKDLKAKIRKIKGQDPDLQKFKKSFWR